MVAQQVLVLFVVVRVRVRQHQKIAGGAFALPAFFYSRTSVPYPQCALVASPNAANNMRRRHNSNGDGEANGRHAEVVSPPPGDGTFRYIHQSIAIASR